jgi:hypothetical protein
MGYINLEGAVISGNGGDGILIIGDPTVEAKGAHIIGNAGSGVVHRQYSPIEGLGIEFRIDPKELAKLLEVLRLMPDHVRQAAVEKSEFPSKIKSFGLDASTFINNIVSLASNPKVAEWIQLLS